MAALANADRPEWVGFEALIRCSAILSSKEFMPGGKAAELVKTQ
jgi:hypothetical protein